jgi:peptide/nickel transport system substrate-binding protein
VNHLYRKLRFFWRFITALLSKYYLLIIIGAISGAITFSFAPEVISHFPKIRQVKNIAVVGKYSLADLPPEIQNILSIGLTTITNSNTPAPGIASSWTIDSTGKKYNFKINSEFTWHDGTHIKSSDIVYKFRDAIISYPDASHLEILLQDPYAPLPTVLSRPVFKHTTSNKYIGVGSYKVARYKLNGPFLESITLTPTDQSTLLPILKYSFFSSQNSARTAFKLNLVSEISQTSEPGDLANWPNANVSSTVLYDRYIAIFFNTQDPQLVGQSGKNLRLALAYAIDKSVFTNRAYTPIAPISWAYNSDVKKYDQDLIRAKDLLSKVEKIPEIITLSTTPTYLKLAETIKTAWTNLGLHVTITVSPDIPDTYQVLLLAQAIPVDPDQYNLWHSTQGNTNLTHLKNPRIDKLLEDGRKTLDISTRKKIYQDFQKYLAEEAPAIFLNFPQAFTISRK